MYSILIIEDDDAIRELLEMNLSVSGYSCQSAANGYAVLDLLRDHSFDLAVVDIMLPGLDGYELMPYLKQAGIPVIYVSAKVEIADRVRGLRLGAEDYLIKPFSILELLVRIEKILDRHHPQSSSLQLGSVRIDPAEHQVWVDGTPVNLKPMEFALLLMLMKHPGVVFSREQLLSQVWGDEYFGETRTVDNHIAILRKKLNWSQQIVTVHRIGYKLEVHECSGKN